MLKFIVLLFLCVGYVNISFGDAVIFSGDGVKALKNKIKFKDGGDVTYDGTNIDINVGDGSIHQIQPDGAFLLQPQSGFGGSGGRLKLAESAENGADFIGIYGHENLATSYGIKMPNVAPIANQVLQSDAGGQLSWVTLPAGSDPTRINDGNNDTYVDTDEIIDEVVISSASTIMNWSLGVLTLDTLPEALLSPKIVFREPLRAGFPQEEIGLKAPDDIPDGGSYTLELDPIQPQLGQFPRVDFIEGGLYDLKWVWVDDVRDQDGNSYIRPGLIGNDDIINLSAGGTELLWNPGSQLELKGSVNSAKIEFYESSDVGTNKVTVSAPYSINADWTMTLPPSHDATMAGYFLQVSNTGSTRWFHPSRLEDSVTIADPLIDDVYIDLDDNQGFIGMGFEGGSSTSQNGGWQIRAYDDVGRTTGAFLQLTDSTDSANKNVSIAAPVNIANNYTITLPTDQPPTLADHVLVNDGNQFGPTRWEIWDPTRISDSANTFIDADFVPNFLWMQAGDGSTARLGGGDFRLQSNLGSVIDNVELQLYEDPDVGADYVGFKAPTNVNASYALTLPADPPTADQVLQSNASGVLSWVESAAGGFNLPYCVGRVGDLSGSSTLVDVVCGNGFTGVTSNGSTFGFNELTVTGPAVPTTGLHGFSQPWGSSSDWTITQTSSDPVAGTVTTRMFDSNNTEQQTWYMFLIIGIP